MAKRELQDIGTGLREIDAGNEGLCFLLERIFADPLTECRRRHGKCDHNRCTKISALLTYIGRNFADQERIMDDDAYPLFGDHVRDHAHLVSALKSMQVARVCADEDGPRVRAFITRWTARHVHTCDRPLGAWVAKIRSGGTERCLAHWNMDILV